MEKQMEFQPGQRVRHRYQHWWGTVVNKRENSIAPGDNPALACYVVSIDGGTIRDDIRAADLTLS